MHVNFNQPRTLHRANGAGGIRQLGRSSQLPETESAHLTTTGAEPGYSGDLAWAMVDVGLRQTPERQGLVFENRDIRAMIESLHPPAG